MDDYRCFPWLRSGDCQSRSGLGRQAYRNCTQLIQPGYLQSPDNVFSTALDVTNEPQVKTAVDAALKHFGRIEVLVNNAGRGLLGAIEETSAEEVESIFHTNVFGMLNVTRAVLPSMRERRSGHIINISSIGG
jgi:NADP-dependent 3-hydroxy acid dehydrogenase YdfG